VITRAAEPINGCAPDAETPKRRLEEVRRRFGERDVPM